MEREEEGNEMVGIGGRGKGTMVEVWGEDRPDKGRLSGQLIRPNWKIEMEIILEKLIVTGLLNDTFFSRFSPFQCVRMEKGRFECK